MITRDFEVSFLRALDEGSGPLYNAIVQSAQQIYQKRFCDIVWIYATLLRQFTWFESERIRQIKIFPKFVFFIKNSIFGSYCHFFVHFFAFQVSELNLFSIYLCMFFYKYLFSAKCGKKCRFDFFSKKINKFAVYHI